MPNQSADELRPRRANERTVQVRDQLERLRDENARLRAENASLRADNEALRSRYARKCAEAADLHATLDAHLRRSGSVRDFGPLELTAGTSVGPRRRRVSRR